MYALPPIPEYEREFWRIVRESLTDLRWEGDRIIAQAWLDQHEPGWREKTGILPQRGASGCP